MTATLPRLRAMKATAAALGGALAAILTATTPFLDGDGARLAYGVLGALAAFGITYQAPPNAVGAHSAGQAPAVEAEAEVDAVDDGEAYR